MELVLWIVGFMVMMAIIESFGAWDLRKRRRRERGADIEELKTFIQEQLKNLKDTLAS